MNEIEKAITYFEALLERLGNGDSDNAVCATALAALREQAALVHCIDCAHHSVPPKDSEGCIQFLYCNHPHQEKGDSPLIVDFTDFCSCGKRLEVEHDG